MIPKRLHQVWISKTGAPLPENCRKWVEAMAALHPAWEHRLWGNEVLDLYADDAALQAAWARPGCKEAHIVDRLRLLLLRDYGGVYCDVDAEPIQSFDSLLQAAADAEFVAGVYPWSKTHGCRPDVGTLAASQGSSFLRELIETFPDTVDHIGGGTRVAKVLVDRIDCRVRLVNWRYWFANEVHPETLVLQVPHLLRSWAK